MTINELVLSMLPTAVVLALAAALVWKIGAFSQREHRKRVEQLLERIAVAVESQGKV